MTCKTKLWAAALACAILAGCGGGNDGGAPAAGGSPPPPPPPPSGQLGAALSTAAAIPANDSATNSSSAFAVLQANGIPAVTVSGAPVVNFTVFSDGQVKQGLTLSDMSFAIAKLVPGTNGEIDQWQNYVYRTEYTSSPPNDPRYPNDKGSGPGGAPALATAVQATTDPKPSSLPNQLVYRPEGYYTYTFSTDITDPAKTNGVVFEPGRTHRIAIQLRYKNAAGATVLVNPYIDVTFDGNGRSVIVTDPSKTRVMADVSSCNGCHEKLALHGGGRVDVQYCVMCHNPGTTDANSGNVLTMQTMIHKIHAGRLLASQAATQGGENYTIWGYQGSKHDYSEVGFPQDLRNCSVCHSGSNPKTPQGDNWKTRASKESCLTCHASGTGSTWVSSHQLFADLWGGAGTPPKNLPNSECVRCHETPSFSPGRVHFNQNEENSAKYKVVIDSASFDVTGRKVTVKYSVVDTTNGNAPWNLVTSDCTGTGAAVSCSNQTQFGNLRFYLAYANMVGQPTGVTEFTAYNNGSNVTINGVAYGNAYLYKGANDGSNRYTIDIPLAPDTATSMAQGTARVVGVGQIKEALLDVKSEKEPRPPVTPTQLINVVAQHTYRDVVLSGALNPRRQVVSNEKCNVCHGALGTTSGSNTLAEAFHSGARNTVEACALCHDQNRYSSTVMTSGLALSENYSFKRMIHGIHGNSKRTYPFTHGNNVIGAFGKDGLLKAALNPLDPAGFIALSSSTSVSAPVGTLLQPWSTGTVVPAGTPLGASGSSVENYAAEVAYPQLGLNCDSCHVNQSWRDDVNPVGSVVAKPIDPTTLKAGTDPLSWRVISPRAASCTSCHDRPEALNHVIGSGGSSFGNLTQGQVFQVPESCVECHAPGRPFGVDVVHGQK